MNTFPSYLTPSQKDEFWFINNEITEKTLRKAIHDHILTREETDYFVLSEFIGKEIQSKNDIETIQQMLSDLIIPELEALGWKCKFSFGDTGLFIYSTENPPENCF